MAPKAQADPEPSTQRLEASVSEASSLTPVTTPRILERLDAEAACWMVHDEEPIRSSVSLLVERVDGLSVVPVDIDLRRARRGTDAEAVFVCDGLVTVVGSAFVGGKGTIDPRRSFVATFEESNIVFKRSKRGLRAMAPGEATRFGMDLTAAVNAALERAGVVIAQQSKVARRAAKKAGLPGGAPVNIEGAVSVPDSATLLGLRYPVSEAGNPIVLRVDGGLGDGLEAVAEAAVIEIDSDDAAPAGIRDMAFADGRVHLITASSEAAMLRDQVDRPATRHVSVDPDGNDLVVHRSFPPRSRIEGLARPVVSRSGQAADGWWYVVDDRRAVVVMNDERR